MTMHVWNLRLARLALMTVCAAGLMSGSAVAQTYTIEDLGTVGGVMSYGYAINAAGQVTGFLPPSPTTTRCTPFLFRNGVMTDLGTLGGVVSRGLSHQRQQAR